MTEEMGENIEMVCCEVLVDTSNRMK